MADGVAAGQFSEAKGLWPLPNGWCWTTLGKLGSWTGGGTPSKANSAFWTNGTIPWVSPKDMKTTIIGDTEDKITAVAVEGSSAKYVAEGSVLMVMRSGILKHSFPVAVTDRVVTVNQDLRALTPHTEISPHFVVRYLALAEHRVLLDCSKDGTTVDSIEAAALERLPIPVAPLAEQRRIVARVDELFAEIAEGEAALAAARKDLDTFRRALLKAAVTGELTKDWRAANTPPETGHDVLTGIAKARANNGAARGRARRAPDDAQFNASELRALPNGWAWATVEDVGSVKLGRQRAPQHHAGDHMRPYMRVANVFEDRIDLSDVKEMNFTPAEYETFKLLDGDILLNEGQTPDLLGRPAIWRNQVDGCCFQNTLIRFRAEDGVSPEWALLVFRAYLHMKRFKRESQITTNIAHLSAGRFAKIEFPIAPPAEMAEILRRVLDALTSAADALALLDAEAADAARLKQSILKAAFEGQLVPQDSGDEPASVLLARMAASQSPVTRSKRGRARRSAS